jgi:hypothetical protein
MPQRSLLPQCDGSSGGLTFLACAMQSVLHFLSLSPRVGKLEGALAYISKHILREMKHDHERVSLSSGGKRES